MIKTCFSPLKSVLALLTLISVTPAFSATVKGHIKDAKNNEALIGATVYLKENNQINDAAGLDGSYSLKNVVPGTYTLEVQIYSYTTQERTVTVTNATDEIVQDFSMEPDSLMMKEVQVVGSYDKGGDSYARNEEKESNVILNVVSAKTIQLLPDITVGDVMQRVSGVVIEKSVTGGGKYAVIRGMEKRYVLTMVNGVEIPSPDEKNRYVPLDIFPSDIIERLEISKTLIPSMPGAAIGGIINMVLKDAPDRLVLDASVASGYNAQLFNNAYYKFNSGVINTQSPAQMIGEGAYSSLTPAQQFAMFPTGDYQYNNSKPGPDLLGNFTIGDRFLHDRLGVILSGSYQNTYSSTTGFFLLQSAQPVGNPAPNTPAFDDIESRIYSTQQTRDAVHLKVDYDFNPRNQLSFYTVYFQLNQYRSDIINDTAGPGNKGDRKGPGDGPIDYKDETKVSLEHIYNATLKGKDSLIRNLQMDWTAAYSRAWQNTPDWGTATTKGGVTTNPNTGLKDSIEPNIWNSFTRRWFENTDQDFAGYINFNYLMKIARQDVVWTIGAMNRDKQRNQTYDSYKYLFTSSEVVSGTNGNDFNPIPGVAALNPSSVSGIVNTTSLEDPNNYTLQEDVNAFYAQGKVNIGHNIQVLGGIRNENTAEHYYSNQSELNPYKYGTITYSDYLPSLQATYNLTPKMNIKASYFASTSRPNFFQIVPYSISGDYYTEAGNPYLKRTQADNLDLRYEYFPSPTEEILAGVFYKVLTDPIEYAFLRTGTSGDVLMPVNDTTSKATNYGFELQFNKILFKHVEIAGNYTYTHSEITVNELENINIANTLINVSETRPLQGQANHIANLSLIYRNDKMGLEAQVTGVYTGKLITQTSPYYELDYWQMPVTRLDFSFQKRLSKKYKISLYGKVTNILNTDYTVELFPPTAYNNNAATNSLAWLPGQSSNTGSIDHIIVEKEKYGQNFLLGIRYKF